MARKATTKAAAAKAPAKKAAAASTRRAAPAAADSLDRQIAQGYDGTETDAPLQQAERDKTTSAEATAGMPPYVAGGPNVKTSAVDDAIARGERSRFR